MLKIAEEFISIQGEGYYAGLPSYFIRCYGCNLRCDFCDSTHAFNDEYYESDIDDIISRIERTNVTNIVITGGEPLLQKCDIEKLINKLKPIYSVEIETNGTCGFLENCNYQIVYNISPKLQFPNKIHEPVYRPSIYKFVFDSTEKTKERILKFINDKHIPSSKVYIMPMGKTIDELSHHQENAVNFCIANNFVYNHRVHVSIWNDKKGV